MRQEMSMKVKYGGWGLVVGAAAATILGFGWGGWVTGSTSRARTDEAVLASRAAICVAQFMKAPNHAQDLKAFREADSWKRSEVIEKGGWDKMPGQEKASDAVADACTKGIEVLAGL